MHFKSVLKPFSMGAGALLLAAGASGCVAEQEESCADDDVECQMAEEQADSDLGTADQEIVRGRLRPDLAGLRFRTGRHNRAFLMDRVGARRLIPNAATYGHLFGGGLNDWNSLGIYGDLDAVPLGAAFGAGAYLAGVGCGGYGLGDGVGWGDGIGCDGLGWDDGIGCGGCGIGDGIGWGDGLGCGGLVGGVGCGGCGGVFLVDGGFRYPFASLGAFNNFGFARTAIRRTSFSSIRGLGLGSRWAW